MLRRRTHPTSYAQRRPGPQPRRHCVDGDLDPGKPRCAAQRRPGPQPRRHGNLHLGTPGHLPYIIRRSTKAGASTPATHWPTRTQLRSQGRASLNEGRGLNPGDTGGGSHVSSADASCSAQRRPGPQPRRHSARCLVRLESRGPLNEGRGLNPGDTANHIRAPLQRRIVQFSERQKQYACP